MLEWDVWLIWSVLAKFVVYLTSLLAVGSMLIYWLLKPMQSEIKTLMFRTSLIAAALAALFTMLRISLQAGQLYDEGIIGLYDMEMIGLVTEGPLGTSSYVRLAGLVTIMIAVIIPALRMPLVILGSILVTSSFALVGHATKDQMILGTLITLHLLAVSYWLGGLYPLYKLSDQSDSLSSAGETAHKFGKQAAIIVPILIVFGLAFAIYLVGSPIKLLGTEYGLILMTKVIVVALLLGLAALNKFRIVPMLLEGQQSAAHHLRTSIRLEFLAFILIFAITAVLTSAVNLPDM